MPDVKIPISSNKALRRSPKPGARTATILMIPLNLLTIIVAKASFSMSSAMISKGRPVFATCSKIGTNSC